ncbi:DUF2306 domain-containing protein [Shewanella atlantica]|uniref:DUF2306 domain-containing protein n=1 Tax=Shewanella atlantica TaxID=271099 RepID=A0A3S0KBZ1_9GAMM|nr:DUF2306 domain-containing protein [Shewanella atlantica]RTR27192.1 DUF2306 domain-containing protein [Shewanella atlantica]
MSEAAITKTIAVDGVSHHSTNQLASHSTSRDWLGHSAKLWFAVTVMGQWLFAAYVAIFYGGVTFSGDLAGWNKVMPHGYVAGDTIGNLAVGMHLFLALVVLIGGPLQLIPQIRSYAPKFHRFNGRIYILTAFILSLGGLFMVWTRGVAGGEIGKYSISLNAILIMMFAGMAVYHAIKRDIKTHRRWALRLFIAMGGVWFFRIGLMLWLMVHQAPVGFDPKTFEGPFLSFLGFAQYLIPLAVAQLYFAASDSKNPKYKLAISLGLVVLTLAMAGGIFAASMGMWLPRI